MSGITNYPTGLDDDTSLLNVTDAVSPVIATHHNNTKEAVKAIEAKLGIYSTSAPTSIDYRLGNPTGGHNHNGASGQGGPITAANTKVVARMEALGSAVVGSNVAAPMVIPRTLILESIAGALRRGPSGATAAFDVLFGPTSVHQASQGLRLIFPPGATVSLAGAPNLVTYPSGGVITVDIDNIGSSSPGIDLGITLVFRDTNA